MPQIFLTTGTTTWTVPDDCVSATIDTIGSGSDGVTLGGAGAGGAWSRISGLSLTPRTVITVSIGARGSTGGDTWFNGATFGAASVGAKGGGPASTGTGGTGGAAASRPNSGGTSGNSGGNGGSLSTDAGGGGGAAGPNGNGNPGNDGTVASPGDGGSADAGSGGAGGTGSAPGGGTGFPGAEYDGSHGSGGGGGGASVAAAGSAGFYGGGGGACLTGGTQGQGGPGLIRISYTSTGAGVGAGVQDFTYISNKAKVGIALFVAAQQFSAFTFPPTANPVQSVQAAQSGLLTVNRKILYQSHFDAAWMPLGSVSPTTPSAFEGLQDLSYSFKKSFKSALQQNEISVPQGFVANTPKTSGLQDLDRSKWSKPKLLDFLTWAIPQVGTLTPVTAGVQDFPLALFKKPFKSSLQQNESSLSALIQIAGAATANNVAQGQIVVNRKLLYQGLFSILVAPTTSPSSTPTTAGLQQVDQPNGSYSKVLIADFAGEASVPAFFTAGAQPVEHNSFIRPWKPSSQQVTTNAPTTTVALVTTPTTAGLQDNPLALFKKSFASSLQQNDSYLSAVVQSAGTSIVANVVQGLIVVNRAVQYQGLFNAPVVFVAPAVTPTTSGIQDLLPVLYKKKFKVWLYQDASLAPFGYVSNTPVTGGIQDFPLALYQKPFKASLQQVTTYAPTLIVSALTPVTAGLQDLLPALYQPLQYRRNTASMPFSVWTGQPIITTSVRYSYISSSYIQ